jgi:rhomboid protease GluP
MFFVDEWLGDKPGMLYGPLVAEGEWWRVLWTVIEHGGPIHLALNMSVVFTLGQALERSIRTWRFILVSLIGALGSSAFVLIFAFEQPTVGASGMIIGWLGAMLPIATKAGRRQLFTWLVQIAVISLIPGVSWQGHLGGLLFGLPAGWALRSKERFVYVAPIILFLTAIITFVAGSGRLAL